MHIVVAYQIQNAFLAGREGGPQPAMSVCGFDEAGIERISFGWRQGMGKSGGEKMQAAGQKRAAADERKNTDEPAGQKKRDASVLERETERLRAELAAERERVKVLEEASSSVAARLDRAIESVKAILARQG